MDKNDPGRFSFEIKHNNVTFSFYKKGTQIFFRENKPEAFSLKDTVTISRLYKYKQRTRSLIKIVNKTTSKEEMIVKIFNDIVEHNEENISFKFTYINILNDE